MKFPHIAGFVLLSGALIHLSATEDVDSAPKQPTDFKSFDTDGDGRISLAEFTAPAERHRAANRAKGKEKPKSENDVSHDGVLSPADTIEGRYSPEVFKQLDINHDNFITPPELEALFGSAHNISQP